MASQFKLSDYYMHIAVIAVILLVVWALTGWTLTKNVFGGASEKKGVLAFYYVDWCGFCNKAKPEWEKLEKDNSVAANLMKVHCEEQAKLAADAGIQGYPTFIYYPNGMSDPGYTFHGAASSSDLKKFVADVQEDTQNGDVVPDAPPATPATA